MVRVIVSTLSPLDDNRWSYKALTGSLEKRLVSTKPRWSYLVEVTESDGSGSQTRHKVSMDKEYYEKIINGIVGPEDFVKKSFEFLSKREAKDAILKEFNIKQIREYFPEYETEIKRTIREPEYA